MEEKKNVTNLLFFSTFLSHSITSIVRGLLCVSGEVSRDGSVVRFSTSYFQQTLPQVGLEFMHVEQKQNVEKSVVKLSYSESC